MKILITDVVVDGRDRDRWFKVFDSIDELGIPCELIFQHCEIFRWDFSDEELFSKNKIRKSFFDDAWAWAKAFYEQTHR